MADRLHLALDGFEGPMDLLLDLAQREKVDWSRLSILAIVDQYLAIVADVRLELAADWLVMAAWLTWLKSRLLMPDPVSPVTMIVFRARTASFRKAPHSPAW